MNRFPSKETVERVRAEFPTGSRVALVSMGDPYTTLKPGDQGTVNYVDSIGTVFVEWDNGSCLGAVYGADVIRRLDTQRGIRKITEQDLDALIGTEYSGFTILRARIKGGCFSDSDHYGIALARSESGQYVTWQFHIEDSEASVYWGHYHMENADAAIADYERRE